MNGAHDGRSNMAFNILKAPLRDHGARLGRLACQGKRTLDTPHYVGITSRGVIPHLSQDTMARKTDLQGVYVALEDCKLATPMLLGAKANSVLTRCEVIEKASTNKIPPLLNQQNVSTPAPLHGFIALPGDQLLVLGARRVPPVVSPHSNTETAVSIYTSVGFGYLEASEYANAARRLKPDILIGLGDIPTGNKPGSRRMQKMSGRTEQHMREILQVVDGEDEEEEDTGFHKCALFAPILPIEKEQQSFYLELLIDEWKDAISGLAIYDIDTAVDIPEPLRQLPRLSLSGLDTPHKLLREVWLGIDIFTIPFIGAATDAGVALDFRFTEDSVSVTKRPLGLEMPSTDYAANLEPLSEGCDCFACTKHHRAYIQHLLSAKEMLAWVLLQVHNLSIIDRFFADIRKSIAEDRFKSDCEAFSRTYENDMPAGTGQGPRVRGYQYKSEGPGEAKRNPTAFKMREDRKEQNSEAPVPDLQTEAGDLVEQGFAKPVDTES